MNEAPLILDADKAAATMCKRHLSYFVKEFWDVTVANPLVWNWHMQVLCDEIQASDELVFKREKKLYDLIINVPPGTSKTKIVSVMSTAWEFARMPGIKVFVGSYSDTAVSGISDEIRMIMKSEKYRRYFPDTEIRKDRDSLHNFKTTAKGEFFAFTVGGTLTSKHADILKVDDPLNPKQAASEAELLKANNFFDKTLPTRKVDKEVTPTYLIMQRLAANDPTGHLLEKKGENIRHVCLPGTLGKNVKPEKYREYYEPIVLPAGHPLGNKDTTTITGLLDANRLNVSALEELRQDLGSATYAGQIDQAPAPEGGLIWQRWFRVIPDEMFPDISKADSLGSDWDLAYTDDEDNAASAYVTSGKVKGQVYIFDFDWAWLEFPDLIKWMKTKHGPHYIEAKASGKSAKQTLTQQGVIAIEIDVKGGSDKVARARSATPIVEAGMAYLKKSMAERLYTDSKQGILFFPKGQYKDLADALAQAMQRHSTQGVRVMGDDDDEKDALDELDFD